MLRPVLIATVWLATRVAVAQPAEDDLFRRPQVDRVALSPDGKHVAWVDGVSMAFTVRDLTSGISRTVRAEPADLPPRNGTQAIVRVDWLGPTRLLLSYNYSLVSAGLVSTRGPQTMPLEVLEQIRPQLPRSFSGFAAVDLDGKRWTALPGYAQRGDSTPEFDPSFTWDARKFFIPPHQTDVVLAPGSEGKLGPHPHLARLDAARGRITKLVPNPGRVTQWIVDYTGKGALGVDAQGTHLKLLAPADLKGTWAEVADLGPKERVHPLGFDGARGLAYFSRLNEAGLWAFTAFKLKERAWTGALGTHGRYDVAPPYELPRFAGIDLDAPLFSPKTGLPLAIGFISDGPRQQCLDSRLAAAQKTLTARHAGLTSFIVGLDTMETRALALSWSAREPGIFSVIDLDTQAVTFVAERMPWLRAMPLADTFPLTFRNRSGLELDAYLTVPHGGSPERLPLVLLVREDPWRRSTWGFQAPVQALARAGFAVLQVNPRGSTGYGLPFLESGKHRLPDAIVEDLIDAVRWVVASGVADAQRIAIAGSSFGGTLALLTLKEAPDLFRCAAAHNAVVDWRTLLRDPSSTAHRHWRETMQLFQGVPSEAQLITLSPKEHIQNLTHPILFAHAEDHPHAPVRSVKALANALRKAGRAPETFFYAGSRGDAGALARDTAAYYAQLARFLTAHVGSVQKPSSASTR
jgi:dipeptidyl aminopeptidase/acylaminoacyl peptidase